MNENKTSSWSLNKKIGFILTIKRNILLSYVALAFGYVFLFRASFSGLFHPDLMTTAIGLLLLVTAAQVVRRGIVNRSKEGMKGKFDY